MQDSTVSSIETVLPCIPPRVTVPKNTVFAVPSVVNICWVAVVKERGIIAVFSPVIIDQNWCTLKRPPRTLVVWCLNVQLSLLPRRLLHVKHCPNFQRSQRRSLRSIVRVFSVPTKLFANRSPGIPTSIPFFTSSEGHLGPTVTLTLDGQTYPLLVLRLRPKIERVSSLCSVSPAECAGVHNSLTALMRLTSNHPLWNWPTVDRGIVRSAWMHCGCVSEGVFVV